MKKLIFAALMASTLPALAVSTPVAAQSSSERYRFDEAQRRYDRETRIYETARDRYERRGGRSTAFNNGYRQDQRPNSNYADDRNENGYDAAKYYREDARYQERNLGADDRVYRGNDGRYYCKRNDGTTGLIIGAVGGGVLGNVIDGGHSRAAGTLIGGALGALAGREVERSQSVRCK
jgi:Glycine zipper 2TM domain